MTSKLPLTPEQAAKREQILATHAQARLALESAQKVFVAENLKLQNFDSLPEHNVFTDVETAEAYFYNVLRNEARLDCEVAGECGLDHYSADFCVDGSPQVFRYIMDVEYNRHDKTYYYVDGVRSRVELVQTPACSDVQSPAAAV